MQHGFPGTIPIGREETGGLSQIAALRSLRVSCIFVVVGKIEITYLFSLQDLAPINCEIRPFSLSFDNEV